MNFRTLRMPSDRVGSDEFARQRRDQLGQPLEYTRPNSIAQSQLPRFGPAWKACLCELNWSRVTTTASLRLRVLPLLLAIATASRQCGYLCDN